LRVIAALNVCQPATARQLEQWMNGHIPRRSLGKILSNLVSEGKIVAEDGYYRITHKGESAIAPGRAKIARDIHRMYYLVEHSDKGR